MQKNKVRPSLWTRDFTILTLGSVVSMVGSTLSWFAISIMVLDYTGSTFLYVLFNVCFQIPGLVMPLLAGPYLDRMSRKKVIYGMDFLSAGIYLAIALLLWSGWFRYSALLLGGVIIGSINSIYTVAFDSFFPNLITEGNFTKAYSVSSLMSDLSGLSYPLGALLYQWMGAPTLFAVTAGMFFIAACFETAIRCQETHMVRAAEAGRSGAGALRQFGLDLREGMNYLRGEKGLLAIALYFMLSSFVGGGTGNLYLPFFQNNAALFAAWPVAAATLYTFISNCSVVGRLVGGAVHYKIKIPARRKFTVAVTVYAVLCFTGAAQLWLSVPLMAALFFADGLLSVTSYNIRIAATQSYVPDGKRARFSGAFSVLSSLGSITGSLAGGALAEVMPERWVIVLFQGVGLAAVWFFIIRNREHVAAIYNREL